MIRIIKFFADELHSWGTWDKTNRKIVTIKLFNRNKIRSLAATVRRASFILFGVLGIRRNDEYAKLQMRDIKIETVKGKRVFSAKMRDAKSDRAKRGQHCAVADFSFLELNLTDLHSVSVMLWNLAMEHAPHGAKVNFAGEATYAWGLHNSGTIVRMGADMKTKDIKEILDTLMIPYVIETPEGPSYVSFRVSGAKFYLDEDAKITLVSGNWQSKEMANAVYAD